jgi:hypothetical protein
MADTCSFRKRRLNDRNNRNCPVNDPLSREYEIKRETYERIGAILTIYQNDRQVFL